MTSRRILSRFRHTLTLGLIVLVVGLLGMAGFHTSKGAAEREALGDGGFSQVTKVERVMFAWCRKNYTPYEVTGVRNGEEVTVTVCASWLHSYSK